MAAQDNLSSPQFSGNTAGRRWAGEIDDPDRTPTHSLGSREGLVRTHGPADDELKVTARTKSGKTRNISGTLTLEEYKERGY
jgi:hypothetical protein